MQKEGSPRFLRHHPNSPVKGIAFSPRDRHLFASCGASDGKVNFYSAAAPHGCELLVGYQLTSAGSVRQINGIKFTSDGCRIIAATNNKRLTVVDVERGEQIQSYDNSAFSGREHGRGIPMACDPRAPHLAVCCSMNGKGLTSFDLRMPLPLDFVQDLHSSVIRDVTFLHPTWPFVKSPHHSQTQLVTLSHEGSVKVSTMDGRTLHCFEVGHAANCIAVTPEEFSSTTDPGFTSLMMIGGDTMSRYIPDVPVVEVQEPLKDKCCSSSSSLTGSHRSFHNHHHHHHHTTHSHMPSGNIWKMRYTSCGSFLYTATDTGVIKRYRRYPDGQHKYLGDVFCHRSDEDVFDMDISPLDEFLVTASKDKTVGLLCLGDPSHGFTSYTELT